MKKQIFFLVMVIVALSAIVNLTSCKKKDDPTPSNSVIGCAKTYLVVEYSSDWNVEYTVNSYTTIFPDTLISNGNPSSFGIKPNASGCENNGSTIHYHFWNSDSSVVVFKDLYCPPNDTVTYHLN